MEDLAWLGEGSGPLAGPGRLEGLGREQPLLGQGWGWFLEEVGFGQRFERGGLNLVEKRLGSKGLASSVELGLGVQGRGLRPECGRGLGHQGKDPGRYPQVRESHRRVEAWEGLG